MTTPLLSKPFRVLVTRPLQTGKTLCEKIDRIGGIAEHFPVMDIVPTPHQKKLYDTIETLPSLDIAIFLSRSAAHFGIQAISKLSPLQKPLWVAIGPGTENLLKNEGGLSSVLTPKPPYETESLLSMDIFQSPFNKHIALLKGNGGRELLQTTLQERGANIHILEVYQRQLLVLDMVENLKQWHHPPIQVIISTSSDSLHHLWTLVSPHLDLYPNFKEIPIVVVGLRMLELAHTLGFKRPMVSMGADDASIMTLLTTFKEKNL